MQIDTILFDLDGTLLNSLGDLAASVNYALQQCGYPPRSLDEVRRFVGDGVVLLMDRAVPTGTAAANTAECLSIMREHYQTHMCNKTKPYDGICDLLTALKQRHIKMAVISNKFDAAVKKLCAEWFGEWIALAVGESETVAKKPAPAGVLSAMKTLGSSKKQTLYVGDSEVDIATARNAAIRSVGVTWGFRDRAILENARADFIIERPAELLKLID